MQPSINQTPSHISPTLSAPGSYECTVVQELR